MRVGILQTMTQNQPRKNVQKVTELIADKKCDLWVLPELFHTSLEFRSRRHLLVSCEEIPDGPTTQGLIKGVSQSGSLIVAGIAERQGEIFYNAAVLVGPDGMLAHYRKLHLFYSEKKWFTPGNIPLTVTDIGLARVGIMICFDHFYPEAARTLAFRGADIIAHPAGLFVPDIGQQTMQVRARENGVYTITSNRVGSEISKDGKPLNFVGGSQIVNPTGAVVSRASSEREELRIAEIEPIIARDKSVGLADAQHHESNDRFCDRQPQFYEFQPGVENPAASCGVLEGERQDLER